MKQGNWKASLSNLARSCLKNKTFKNTLEYMSRVIFLTPICKDLGSFSSTYQNKTKILPTSAKSLALVRVERVHICGMHNKHYVHAITADNPLTEEELSHSGMPCNPPLRKQKDCKLEATLDHLVKFKAIMRYVAHNSKLIIFM